MTPLSDARDKLAKLLDEQFGNFQWDSLAHGMTAGQYVAPMVLDAGFRLPIPPTDDERETLSAFIDRDLAWAEGDPDKLAAALIERFPGFRRQGPITDARGATQ